LFSTQITQERKRELANITQLSLKKKKTNPSFSRQTNTEKLTNQKLTQYFCYVAEKLTNEQKNGMRT
jgi:hypothetical protein